MRTAWILALFLAAGCASIESTWKSVTDANLERTFYAPVARVKPAFVATLAQMGMPISAIETLRGNETIKSRKDDKSVAIEIERVSSNATRVRVTGSSDAAHQIMRETEKRLGAG